MDLRLQGKVAIVTGASKGIGLGIARSLSAEGARVAMVARGRDELEAAARDLPGEAVAMPCDVTDHAAVERLVSDVADRLGGVDVLVNNAGGVDRFASWDELDAAAWREAFELNVISLVPLTRAVLPHMRAKRWGRIINISSESGVQPDAFMPNYNAAKAAVINMSKSMSKAFAADGILVNTVSPAFICTPIIDRLMGEQARQQNITPAEAETRFLAKQRPHIELKRAGTIDEVGAAVAFLASEAASFITGTNMRVDGGSVASV